MSILDLSGYSFDAIVFDCDGTLVDSAPLHFCAFKAALDQQGGFLDKGWYMDRLGLPRKALITEFSKASNTDIDIDRAVTESETQYLLQMDQLAVLPEVVKIAKAHYGKIPMAVASSGQKLSVGNSLMSTGLTYLFDLILTADDITACKPDPEIYLMAAQRLQIDASRCLVFEDSDEGLLSATGAGAQVIDVRSFAAIYT